MRCVESCGGTSFPWLVFFFCSFAVRVYDLQANRNVMNVTMERISCILELKKMLLIGYGAVKWKDVIWQFVTGKGVLRYSLAEDLQKQRKRAIIPPESQISSGCVLSYLVDRNGVKDLGNSADSPTNIDYCQILIDSCAKRHCRVDLVAELDTCVDRRQTVL